MTDYKASHTALGTAYLRAAHQLLEAKPLLFDDPVALPLLGPEALNIIQHTADNYRTPETLALRTHVVLRSQFTEDRLASAVSRGITQYVILGAGFDTFALRQPAWAKQLKIIEVDHSGTQRMKRSYIDAAGLAMPENAFFADIDFEHESLHDGLLRYNVSMKEPSFFSWLGVTMYLKEEAIDAVLRTVAMFPAGSEIVLTFRPPPGDSPSPLAQSVANLGEPWVSHFEPEALEAKLRGVGFSRVEFLSPAEAEEQYFRHRPKDLPVPKQINILCAVR
ncbi:MAG: class I SAM-dependent methyltransferase [Deltaproteobacteria bacterium]|nr:class I SAM-dependent methyltransferase [Deltaproteobacteria bacterium]